MVQAISFKGNSALIGAGIAATSSAAYGIYAKKYTTNPRTSFIVTNALASLSVMLGMVAKTSSLGWGVRAFSVLSAGAATMIPTVWCEALARGEVIGKSKKE